MSEPPRAIADPAHRAIWIAIAEQSHLIADLADAVRASATNPDRARLMLDLRAQAGTIAHECFLALADSAAAQPDRAPPEDLKREADDGDHDRHQ